MVYDAHAKLLGVKVIGTVESGLDWSAINYTDPITVGFVQWFGTRAASILVRMKQTTHWTGVLPSLDNDLNNTPSSSAWWNTRYLTSSEGASLVPVLTACDYVQVDQMQTDMDVYKGVAITQGMDPDADTASMLFFFTMYHQRPVSALDVLGVTGPHPTLVAIRDAALADPVFSGYPTRYNDAYDLILADDVSGVPAPDGSTVPTEPPNPGGGQGGANLTKTSKYLEVVGDTALLHLADGQKMFFYPDGKGRFIPRTGDAGEPTTVTPPQPAPTGGAWVHPLPTGVMTSGYGPRDASIGGDPFHYGIDFSTPGYPGNIYAPADLVITAAGYGLGSFNDSAGWRVVGHTTDGAYTFTFNHMQYGSLQVTSGQTISMGAQIGVEGATGNVTGRHLHFEIIDGVHDNPYPPPYNNGAVFEDPAPILTSHGVVF